MGKWQSRFTPMKRGRVGLVMGEEGGGGGGGAQSFEVV